MAASLVERMARAMCAEDSDNFGVLFDIHWDEFGSGYLVAARAALAAAREPSEGMVEAGRECGAEFIWVRMIDKALEEGE